MCWTRPKIIIVVSLLFVTFLCSGCIGGQEVDDLSFILTIGIDKSDEPDMNIFTFRIAMPRSFTGDSGGENKDKTKLVSVKSPNITEAIRQLGIALNRNPELSHTSALFISEEVAKEGIYPYLTMFLREQVYLNTMSILVIEGEAKEALKKNTAPFELFQYRWIDSLKRVQKFAASSLINDVNQFYMQIKEPTHAVATGYGTIVDNSLQKKSPMPLPHQSIPQYGVEDFPREGGTELIVVGSAIFRDWKMVGKLNMSEAFGAVLLNKGIQTTLTVEDPFAEERKISLGIDVKNPKVDVDVVDEKMKIDINIIANCELSDVVTDMDYTNKENRQTIEKKINEAIESGVQAYFNATQPFGADCIEISNQYRAKVGTWQEWSSHDWPNLYRNAEVHIKVNSKLKRSGLLWREVDERGAGDNV
ncbi:Ger(x)C family spore germination protein [Anaerosinus sp.]